MFCSGIVSSLVFSFYYSLAIQIYVARSVWNFCIGANRYDCEPICICAFCYCLRGNIRAQYTISVRFFTITVFYFTLHVFRLVPVIFIWCDLGHPSNKRVLMNYQKKKNTHTRNNNQEHMDFMELNGIYPDAIIFCADVYSCYCFANALSFAADKHWPKKKKMSVFSEKHKSIHLAQKKNNLLICFNYMYLMERACGSINNYRLL